MKRIHLFEFEDQFWCPNFIRETTTDFLFVLYGLFKTYSYAFEKINEVLDKTKVESIVDCCTGSGGPIKYLCEYLDEKGKTAKIILTDRYPNIEKFQDLETCYPNKITGHKISIDASRLPSNLKGMRTFFSSFHHFKPNIAKEILQDAVNNNMPIGIFECTQRHPLEFFRVLLSPIMTLFLVPFAKKLTWSKFFFTYILPITPLTHMWEYFASNMRTYSPDELQNLVNSIDAPNYHWEIKKFWDKKSLTAITYLIGYKHN